MIPGDHVRGASPPVSIQVWTRGGCVGPRAWESGFVVVRNTRRSCRVRRVGDPPFGEGGNRAGGTGLIRRAPLAVPGDLRPVGHLRPKAAGRGVPARWCLDRRRVALGGLINASRARIPMIVIA